MAQINLSFRELIDMTSILSIYAKEMKDVSIVDSIRARTLVEALHTRFAEAMTEADLVEDRLLTREVLSHD